MDKGQMLETTDMLNVNLDSRGQWIPHVGVLLSLYLLCLQLEKLCSWGKPLIYSYSLNVSVY